MLVIASSASAKRKHNPSGLMPPPMPPHAPAYHRPMAPSLDKDAFKRILKLVKKQSFDTGKLDMIEAIAMLGQFSSAQCAELLGTFSFDNDRLKALKVLRHTLTDMNDGDRILKTFQFISSREQAMNMLISQH